MKLSKKSPYSEYVTGKIKRTKPTEPGLESADPEGSGGEKCQTVGLGKLKLRTGNCGSPVQKGLRLPVSKSYFGQLSAAFKHLTFIRWRK